MNKKPFYRSRTVWLNVLAAVALFLQNQFGYVFSVELQGLVLMVLNLILRFQTSEPIQLNKKPRP